LFTVADIEANARRRAAGKKEIPLSPIAVEVCAASTRCLRFNVRSTARAQRNASPFGRSHARAMLVEAAWAAAKTPGPLHAFFVRIRAKRGHQIAAVALARKLTVLCWHLLTKETDYLWVRPALVANKVRKMELQAGQPQQKGNRRGPTYASNIKELRASMAAKRTKKTVRERLKTARYK
jgi:hypothetical protein